MFLTIFALVTLILVVASCIEAMIGMRRLRWLGHQSLDAVDLPGVSIVVSARNEEKNIRDGLSSLLALDYPQKQIIVVNDRSTDKTGEILAGLAKVHPEITIVTIAHLPAGWLGKNHAQWSGAKAAIHPFLLFTDADIVMDKTVLRRAVGVLEKERLDHLAIGPRAVMPGVALNVFMAGFAVFFNMFARPWRVTDPKSPAHVGIGAFNLVRRGAYEKIGTHQALSMRPDDDMKLGKLIKLHGLKQNFLLGTDLITVEWYDSVRALVDGLMKNAFSGVDYKLSVVMGSTIVLLSMVVWPYIAVFVTTGTTQALYAAVIILLTMLCALSAYFQKLNPLFGLGFPAATIAFLYILWKATLRTLLRGGIEWRGTFYSLRDLKKNVI